MDSRKKLGWTGLAFIALVTAGCGRDEDDTTPVTPEQEMSQAQEGLEALEQRTAPDPRLNTEALEGEARNSVVEPEPEDEADAVAIPQPELGYEEYDENEED